MLCGQQGYFGEPLILLNMDEINKLENTAIEEKININDALGVDESGQYCSTIISLSIVLLHNSNNTGNIDDDYDMGL